MKLCLFNILLLFHLVFSFCVCVFLFIRSFNAFYRPIAVCIFLFPFDFFPTYAFKTVNLFFFFYTYKFGLKQSVCFYCQQVRFGFNWSKKKKEKEKTINWMYNETRKCYKFRAFLNLNFQQELMHSENVHTHSANWWSNHRIGQNERRITE